MIYETYANWQAPLYVESFGIKKFFDIPMNSRLKLVLPFPQDGRWCVRYGEVIGWLPDKYIEPYVENYGKDIVPMQGLDTPDPNDAAQYALVNKIKQVNLCGELACCYILQVGLKDFLDVWGVRNVPLWKRIFGAGKARGTGPGELVELLACSGVLAKEMDQKKYSRWTPRVLYDFLQAYDILVSVNISGIDGSLRGAGILHWVVPTTVILERQGFGQVEILNPFSNRKEWYSWREFAASAHAPYGCMVDK